MDPRARLAVLIFYLVGAVREQAPSVLGVLWAFAAILVLLQKKGRAYARFLVLLCPSFLVFGGLVGLTGGFQDSLAAALRLAVLSSGSFAAFTGIKIEEFREVLAWFRFPRSLVFALPASIHFLEVVGGLVREVRDNLRLRGLPIDTVRGILFNLPSFLLPVLLGCFRMAEQLAEAMETRGFSSPFRKEIKTLRWKSTDSFVVLISLVAFAAVWIRT